ncbi:carboxypeptidase regulatory-like domain-containing protein [Paraburkholderia sp. Tr-20389]|uniref:carboxypeptidase-like regulatory domain-containing protein n=1 Tax=Paraburkholderia sp. Tr-20389 TaxID=2703903 RepID=UPI00197FC499|nr:carboxypeptidase-like regulatory domain-containing protein [Paraburkholderia sp. Tr-20389]MBN3752215.1 carboxypeptidase regulatory-like domain-containing protein [Paraburkholderia sp. Tr-20389]
MCTVFSVTHRTIVGALLCLVIVVPLEGFTQPARTVTPGDLTTPSERAEFCTKMREAPTHAERRAVAQKWHELLVSRAKEQGADLPYSMGSHHSMMGHDGDMPMGMGMGTTCSGTGTGAQLPSAAGGPPVERSLGIAYVTGGVGVDEAAAMRAMADRYSMRARFTANGGEFVSGVDVRILSTDGRLIFTATSDGPYLYAQVPPGRYRLVAKLNGLERSRSLDIPRRGGTFVSLTWPNMRPASGG